jgi:hypothetical protein
MGKDGSPEVAAKAKNSVPALPSFAGVCDDEKEPYRLSCHV